MPLQVSLHSMSRHSDSPASVPQHVAIVMDGNGRWARQRFMPRLAGHREGVESLKRCVRACVRHGIKVLTVFAFSSENWNRPADEVSGLMGLLVKAIAAEVPRLHAEGVRLHFAGERNSLSQSLQHSLTETERLTSENKHLILNICHSYRMRQPLQLFPALLM